MPRTRIPLPFLLGLLAGLLILGQAGCPEPDDDDTGDDDTGGDPATVEDICATVFECFDNDWGWGSETECQDLWLTGCADESGYLECAGACLTGDCDDFAAVDGTSGCEPDCWSDFCG